VSEFILWDLVGNNNNKFKYAKQDRGIRCPNHYFGDPCRRQGNSVCQEIQGYNLYCLGPLRNYLVSIILHNLNLCASNRNNAKGEHTKKML